jgi:hypothetical protein
VSTIHFYREECFTHGSDIDDCDVSCELLEKDYEITGNVSKVIPARTYGPPEDCYEAEGGEVEIELITLDGQEVDQDIFSPHELEKIDELLFEAAMDDDGYDYEPDDDRDDDL